MRTNNKLAFMADVEILAASADGTGPRRFDVRAYNGGPLKVGGWDLPVVIDLAGVSQAKSVVANLHHDSKALVGHVTDVSNDGKRLGMSGVVSATGASALEFLANADNGFPWQASIEAMPSKVTEIPEGKTVEVNGQRIDGPIYLAKKSKLYGVAFLPRGADENTSVRVAASAAEEDVKFDQWIEAMGFELESLTDKQRAALQLKYDAEVKASATTDESGDKVVEAAPAFDLDEVKAASAEYFAELEATAAEHESDVRDGKKFAELKAGAIKAGRELKAKAIREKWSATRFEVEAIKAGSAFKLALVREEAPRGPAIHSSRRDDSPRVLEAALAITAGLPDIDKAYDEQTIEAAHKGYRNMGLQQFLMIAATANGYQAGPGQRIHGGNLRDVLRYAFPSVHASAGASTLGVSSANILSNVATKELVSGYMEADQSWRMIAAVKSVPDFKQITVYRLLDDMAYEEVGPTGEIKHGTVSQENYTRQAKTYAKMFALTRTDIINDDLGAFDDLRTRLAFGAAMRFNDVFWSAFMNNASFYTSGRGNFISGGTTNLGSDGVGLGLGVSAFRKMTTPTGDGAKRLGGEPTMLLVPPELESIARAFYVSQNLTGSTSQPAANIYVNRFNPVVCPWLSDTSVTGNSTTAWYLLRDPRQYPAMIVSFLNGQQTPTVESADADFDTLGIQFRGYHDFGCDLGEYVSGVKSKGAA